MNQVVRWLAAGALAVGATGAFADAVHRSPARLTAGSDAANSPSRACGECHSPEFSLWVAHPHSHALVVPERDPRLVAGRWTDDAPGWADGSAPRLRRQEVALAFGLLRTQVFLRRDPDGHRLLAAGWNRREERWEPLPQWLERVREERGTWEQRCAGCHVTGFDPAGAGFTERNVGCRACHGDGTEHVARGGLGPILSPARLSADRRTDLCGACHARGRARDGGWPFPAGFVPGEPLARTFAVDRPRPGWMDPRFWPDGTERLPYMEYQGFLQSGHRRVGMSCTTCHAAHGSDNPFQLRRSTSQLCRGCHDPDGLGPVHRGHPAGTSGCVGCHMSVTTHEPHGVHVHTHTFLVLTPGYALETGMPSSCTAECHHGRSLRWADAALQGWRRR